MNCLIIFIVIVVVAFTAYFMLGRFRGEGGMAAYQINEDASENKCNFIAILHFVCTDKLRNTVLENLNRKPKDLIRDRLIKALRDRCEDVLSTRGYKLADIIGEDFCEAIDDATSVFARRKTLEPKGERSVNLDKILSYLLDIPLHRQYDNEIFDRTAILRGNTKSNLVKIPRTEYMLIKINDLNDDVKFETKGILNALMSEKPVRITQYILNRRHHQTGTHHQTTAIFRDDRWYIFTDAMNEGDSGSFLEILTTEQHMRYTSQIGDVLIILATNEVLDVLLLPELSSSPRSTSINEDEIDIRGKLEREENRKREYFQGDAQLSLQFARMGITI